MTPEELLFTEEKGIVGILIRNGLADTRSGAQKILFGIFLFIVALTVFITLWFGFGLRFSSLRDSTPSGTLYDLVPESERDNIPFETRELLQKNSL